MTLPRRSNRADSYGPTDYIEAARERERKQLPRVKPRGPQCQHVERGRCQRCADPLLPVKCSA